MLKTNELISVSKVVESIRFEEMSLAEKTLWQVAETNHFLYPFLIIFSNKHNLIIREDLFNSIMTLYGQFIMQVWFESSDEQTKLLEPLVLQFMNEQMSYYAKFVIQETNNTGTDEVINNLYTRLQLAVLGGDSENTALRESMARAAAQDLVNDGMSSHERALIERNFYKFVNPMPLKLSDEKGGHKFDIKKALLANKEFGQEMTLKLLTIAVQNPFCSVLVIDPLTNQRICKLEQSNLRDEVKIAVSYRNGRTVVTPYSAKTGEQIKIVIQSLPSKRDFISEQLVYLFRGSAWLLGSNAKQVEALASILSQIESKKVHDVSSQTYWRDRLNVLSSLLLEPEETLTRQFQSEDIKVYDYFEKYPQVLYSQRQKLRIDERVDVTDMIKSILAEHTYRLWFIDKKPLPSQLDFGNIGKVETLSRQEVLEASRLQICKHNRENPRKSWQDALIICNKLAGAADDYVETNQLTLQGEVKENKVTSVTDVVLVRDSATGKLLLPLALPQGSIITNLRIDSSHVFFNEPNQILHKAYYNPNLGTSYVEVEPCLEGGILDGVPVSYELSYIDTGFENTDAGEMLIDTSGLEDLTTMLNKVGAWQLASNLRDLGHISTVQRLTEAIQKSGIYTYDKPDGSQEFSYALPHWLLDAIGSDGMLEGQCTFTEALSQLIWHYLLPQNPEFEYIDLSVLKDSGKVAIAADKYHARGMVVQEGKNVAIFDATFLPSEDNTPFRDIVAGYFEQENEEFVTKVVKLKEYFVKTLKRQSRGNLAGLSEKGLIARLNRILSVWIYSNKISENHIKKLNRISDLAGKVMNSQVKFSRRHRLEVAFSGLVYEVCEKALILASAQKAIENSLQEA